MIRSILTAEWMHLAIIFPTFLGDTTRMGMVI